MTHSREPGGIAKPPPNLLLIITDQQRQTMHWPEDPEWLESLLPAEAELSRTGVTFTEACTASCMCSPSRASLFTGRWPAEHGVNLTLTQGGAVPDRKYAGRTIRDAIRSVRAGEISARTALRTVVKGATRRRDGGDEAVLDPATPNLAQVLARAGYRTVLKGKWHLTQPVEGEWGPADTVHLEETYGFEGWEPPDAGENLDPTHFGGGSGSGRSNQGFDEDFARQAEKFLADPPPEPWALIVSLVNPHDVLGFPASYREGGYSDSEWADLGQVGLPPSVDENLKDKPLAHAIMKMGQSSFIGGLNREEQVAYCRFYAHLHRLADSKVARVLEALGDPDDPDSLRSKTVVVKTSDHGDLGMSHGGMRQKMFNAYDETINVPLIVSNPVLFPEAVRSPAPVSLCDILPTLATIAGVDVARDGMKGRDLTPVLAHAYGPEPARLDSCPVDLTPVAAHGEPKASVQEEVFFSFDDHQSGSAFKDVIAPPNRIRAVRSADAMYAVYLDETGDEPPQFELYDMTSDPDQVKNLVDRDTGLIKRAGDQALLDSMRESLAESCRHTGTSLPAGF
ncbi:MAG: sulfatase-like hydrolase/transferase [Actinomycetota bacterium]|nr:sulfatase-like hydrolase/transferase [Actinomycetota bacterium]